MRTAAEAFETLLAALYKLEVPYAVGGSVASSVYGNYRFTNDVDLVVALREEQVKEFLEALGADFYGDAEDIRRAIRTERSANVIHMPTAYKFNLFPAAKGDFRARELGRRQYRESPFGGQTSEFATVSPEDTITAKLDWMRQSGGQSEQQLRDILGVIAVQGDRLDRAYLEATAAALGLAEELRRLL